jgi:GDPmannose 4,6-dehydratase
MRGLITGASGQDGQLLSELLRIQYPNAEIMLTTRTLNLSMPEGENWLSLDLLNLAEVSRVVDEFKPQVIWHLSGASSVADSWRLPGDTIAANSVSTSNLLEAVRASVPVCRVILAGSSEIFSRGKYGATENSTIRPSSPYGISKATNLELGRLYREVHGMNVSTAIMFNHESNQRPNAFLSKSIAVQAAEIALGKRDHILLNDITVQKDWGWAEDFVEAILKMGLVEHPADLILATGQLSSVADMAYAALDSIGASKSALRVKESPAIRPNDSAHPWGDISRTKEIINWQPKMYPQDFIPLMVNYEIEVMSTSILRN